MFTFETKDRNRLAFLDTVTIRRNGHVQVDVYREPTHTDKYRNYDSHYPVRHKQSVLCTHLDRAEKIPTSNRGKRRERKHCHYSFEGHWLPLKFIMARDSERRSLCRNYNDRSGTQTIGDSQSKISNSDDQLTKSNFVLLPYVKSGSEISKILRRENAKVSYKPVNTLYRQFPKSKNKLEAEQPKSVIYLLCYSV